MKEYITIDAAGTKLYYKDKEKTILHRVDGPAVEYYNGVKIWYLNNVQHCMNGPAAELSNGSMVWIINGELIFEVNESGTVIRRLK
jgi:hypothetical protein